jgi:mono/diheme cytochrome c family protein
MNQVRHIFYACFLLILFFTSLFLVKFISSSETSEELKSSRQIFTQTPTYSESNAIGRSLFQQNCQTCHSLDKDQTGPALRGFTSRGPWADKKEVYKWIRNPAGYISKNKYAASLQKQYGSIMQSFELTNEEIDHIINYIESSPVSVYTVAAR